MALIDCPECGEHISDKANYCPKCGCPSSEFKKENICIDSNAENTDKIDSVSQTDLADDSNGISMPLGYGIKIVFNAAQNDYIEFSRIFYSTMYNLKIIFISEYKEKVQNFADIYKIGYDILAQKYKEYIDTCVEILLEKGIENYDFDRFFEMTEKEISFEEVLNPLTQKAIDIFRESDRLKENVASEAANRNRWVGGGFGISGALTGAVKAGALNFGSGILHSIGDSITNSQIDERIYRLQENIFQDPKTLNFLCDALLDLCYSAFFTFESIVSEYDMISKCDFDPESASAIFGNYRNQYENEKISETQLYQGIAVALSHNPYLLDAYLYLYSNFRDKDRMIYSIVKYLGIDPEYLLHIMPIDSERISALEINEEQTIEELKKNKSIYELILKSNPKGDLFEKDLKLDDFDIAIKNIVSSQKEAAQKISYRLDIYDDFVKKMWNLIDGKDGSSEYILECYLFQIMEDDIRNGTGAYDTVINTIQQWAKDNNEYKKRYALYLLCQIMGKRSDISNQARRTMVELCNEGIISAVAMVGFYYYNGNDIVGRDENKAVKLFTYASERCSPMGMAWLGFLYYHGYGGVKRDSELGRKLLEKAAYYKHPMALKKLEEIDHPTESDEGCFITTAVCKMLNKPDDCYELTQFRMFRDTWLLNQPDGKELVRKYYQVAPIIVDSINKLSDCSDIYWSILTEYLDPCLKYIESCKFKKCKETYMNMVQSLERKYVF